MTADLTVGELPPETTLNMGSVVQQVADVLDGAAPAALSLAQLVDGYQHIPDTDFTRLRRIVEDLRGASDPGVLRWMARRALALINTDTPGDPIEVMETGYRLREGVSFDDLRVGGRPIVRPNRTKSRLGDPFNPKTTTSLFVQDIRSKGAIAKDDLTELVESMEEFGWADDPIFDAIEDEHGVLLVGHRRVRVAAQLGIDPRNCGRPGCTACPGRGHIRTVRCGYGDPGDIKRVQLAVISNIGRRGMTKGDRQNIVKILAGEEHDWAQMSIAKALGVTQQQISLDIRELEREGALQETSNVKLDSLGRKRSPGRPRQGPNQHPPFTENEENEFYRLREEENMSITAAEAQIRGWDKPRRSPTTTVSRMIGRREHTNGQAPAETPAAQLGCICGGTCPCHDSTT